MLRQVSDAYVKVIILQLRSDINPTASKHYSRQVFVVDVECYAEETEDDCNNRDASNNPEQSIVHVQCFRDGDLGIGWRAASCKHNQGVSFILCTLRYNSPEICLSLFANWRSQFLLDRVERCIKLLASTESTSCHEFASQFGLAIFLHA